MKGFSPSVTLHNVAMFALFRRYVSENGVRAKLSSPPPPPTHTPDCYYPQLGFPFATTLGNFHILNPLSWNIIPPVTRRCPLCLFLMCEPVTTSCGHTFCRRCAGGYLPSKCPSCTESLQKREEKSMKNNVLLISVVEKCCPDETKAKCHLQEKLKASEFAEALRIANEGLYLVPNDQSLKLCRAEANWGLTRFSDALTDLDYLCCLRPNWTEGFFRKGSALLEMGHQTEALIQFHRCLKLQADFVPAKSQIQKVGLRAAVCISFSLSGESGLSREKTLGVLTVSDFECPLCIRLFFEPVTTPCGHTFCKNCIERSLDHNLRCPLCKQPLQEYFKNRKYNPTVLLQDIMTRLFPSPLAERKQVHDAEMAELSNLTTDIPIFVCTVAYPGVPCPLHIFEPRYRLMMRRCMDTGTKKFGMCCYEHGKGFADYGCLLEIHSLELLPDGRSFVDAAGCSRFKVLKRGQRDGYHTADIEYLEDLKVDGSELEVLEHLHDSVYQQAQDWYQHLGIRIRDQINRQYGTMPDKEENIQASSNGPAWCWWLLSVLQLDPAYQTTVLSLASLKDRLGHLRLILEYFSQS
uniref:LON peptidase N-terminal domain and ring finger 4 n=1 Tax=Cyclopterus lumpus TaxID=8103 RepID=A0A8C3AUL1_CYCLU